MSTREPHRADAGPFEATDNGIHEPALADRGADEPADALGFEDGEALDALVAAGFDLSRVPARLHARCGRIAAVLGMLFSPTSSGTSRAAAPAPGDDGNALIDVTLARVASDRSRRAVAGEMRMHPDDDDALEALVASGMDAERTSAGIRRRAVRQRALLGLLDLPRGEIGGADALVGRTLDRVQRAIDAQEERMAAETAPPQTRRFRFADLTTVAALLLIAGAAITPMVGSVREYSRRLACETNLAAAGLGFGAYANDSRDALPMASASMVGSPWWNIGNKDESNSANLYTLTRTGHATVRELACAGNAAACRVEQPRESVDWQRFEDISYSYQNMFARERAAWNGPSRVVVVSDRSPVVVRAKQGRLINPVENSLNHGGRGQNVLFNDGSTLWLRTPVLESKDNIWLPRTLEEAIARKHRPTEADPIQGTENPDAADDAFVAP